ncbi:MAG: gliding motility-associated C-terminal domain-containing protein [Chitinophagales bacterium]
MKKICLCCITAFLLFSLLSKAQLPYIKPCYGINAGLDSSFCSPVCKNISRIAVPQYENRATNTYQVLTMTLPSPMYNNTGTNVIVNQDDVWSGVVNMPFNFCFFGNTYNKFVIGANGLISFNTAYANLWCEYAYTGGIPDAAKPINSIMGAYTDIDPSVGFSANRINWYIEGAAPCRRAVINFYRVPMFSSSCNSLLFTSQIVLHEAYNIIDVIVVNKPVCSSWNGGRGIIGIQNANGLTAFAAPGQNPSTSNLTNTCYRFLPNGALQQSINWTEGATTISNTATLAPSLCPGTTRTFTANLVNNRCDGSTVIVSDDVTFTVNNGGANAGPDRSLSCIAPNITIGTPAQANTTYSWSPAAGLSNANIAQPTTNTPNTYIVTATNASTGCTGTDTVIVSPLTNPVANAGPDKQINCSGPTTQIGTPAIAGHTYSWSPAAGLDNPNVAQPNASVANTYTLTITNTASGCTATDAVTVTIDNTPPTANAGANQTLTCANPSLQIGTAAVAGNTYSWASAAGLSNANIAQPNATAAGTYTLTVTKTSNGCTATDAVTISVDTLRPGANAGVDQTLTCTNTSYLIGTPTVAGNTYSWSPAAGLSNASIAQPTVTAPGLYTVTVTKTSNGCSNTDNVTISKDVTTPVANAGPAVTLTCSAPSLQIGTASIAGNTYSWSPAVGLSNASIAQPNATKTGTYTLTVTQLSNGCTATDAVTVSIDTLRPNANAGADKIITCANPTHVIGTTAVAGNTYAWLPSAGLDNASIAQPTASATGTYTLTVTKTSNGCTNTDAVTVTVDTTRPTANAGTDKVITCANPTHMIGTTAIAGNTYAWSPGAGLSNANIAQPTASSIGTYTVTVTKTANGCTATNDVTITIDTTSPGANAGADKIITCSNPTHVIGTPATAGNTYSWSPGAGLSNANIAQPTVSSTGNYFLTVTKTANGCTSTNAVLVTVDTTRPTANAGTNVTLTCTNPSLQIGTTAIAGNTYSWTPNTGLSNTAIAQPNANTTGTYTLIVTKTANGCSNSDIVIVAIDTTKPVANAGANVTLTCTNPSLQIGTTAISGNTYSWTPNAGLSNASIAQPNVNTTGTYTVTVTKTANGCTSADAVTVAVDTTRPGVNAGTNKIITCSNPTHVIGFSSGPGTTYSWSPSAGLSDATIAQPTVSAGGNYILTVTKTSNGCTAQDAVLVSVDTVRPIANSGTDKVITCNSPTFVIGTPAIAGNTYAWTPAIGLSNASIAQPTVNTTGTYTLTVTKTVNGCTSVDSVKIAVDTTRPVADAGADKVITCSNPTHNIGTPAIAGNTYAWVPASGLNNPGIAQPVANTTGTYTVTVTKTSNGCFASDAVTISVDTSRPFVFAGNDKLITCSNPTHILGTNPIAGNTYLWSPATGLSAANIAQPTVNLTGTYTLTATKTSNGCTASDIVNVTVDTTIIIADAGLDKVITCSAPIHIIGTPAVAGATYAWSPSVGLNNANIAQPTANTTGNYVLTVTKNSTGCTSTDVVVVSVDTTKPVANAGADKLITCTNPTHTIGTTAIAGNTYSWTPASGLDNTTIAQPTVNTTGTYTVTVTKTANGCIATDEVTVAVDTTKPVADAGASVTLTCTNPSLQIGTAAISGNTYFWSPSAGLSNTGSAQPTVNTPGIYTVTVTKSANGCTSTDAVTVAIDTIKPIANAGANQLITCANPTYVLGTPAVTGNTYAWTPGTGLSDHLIAQPTVSASGNYTLIVTKTSNGCVAQDGISVTVDTTKPFANAGTNITLTCTNPSLQIGSPAIAGNTYSWIPVAGLDNPAIAQPTVNTTGTYTVTVTKTANGCSSTDAVVVAIDTTKPTADAGVDKIITCTNTTQTIGTTAIAGNTYVWTSATGLNNTSIAQPTVNTTGTYTVTVTKTSNGCSASDAVTVSVDTTKPFVFAGNDKLITCANPTQVIGSGPMTGVTYSWSPATGLDNAAIAQPSASAAGNYIVTGTKTANGCKASDLVIVSIDTTHTAANAGANVTLTCTNPALQIGTAAIAGNTYSWSPAVGLNNANIAQPTANITGNYTVTVTRLSNGCVSTDVNTVAIDTSLPVANAGADKVLTCSNPTQMIGTSAIAGNTYVWSPATGLSSTSIAQPTVNTTGTYTVTVTKTSNGCSASDAVIVTVDTSRSIADAGVNKTLTCAVRSQMIGTDAIAGNAYSWSPSIGLTNANIAQPSATEPNTYTVTVTKLSNGCTSTDAVNVLQNINAPAANIGFDKVITCANPTQKIGSPGSAAYSYSWSPAAGLDNANIAQPTASAPGTYVLTVTMIANGCTAIDGVTVGIDTTKPVTNAGADIKLTCTNPAQQIGTPAISGNTYAWTPAAGLNSTTLAQPTVNAIGTYSLTVTKTINGCTKTDAVVVTRDTSFPVANAGEDQILTCTKTLAYIGTGATNGYAYAWSPATGLSNTTVSQPRADSTGTFTVTVTKLSNGCKSTDSITITRDTIRPVAFAGDDQTFDCPHAPLVLGTPALDGMSYTWTPVSGISATNVAQPTTDTAGTYVLKVKNNVNGCVSLPDTVVTFWKNCNCDFLLPAAFSPNNDGVNDNFKPLRFCDEYSDLQFSVFDRWGALLFTSNDLTSGWDGFLKNAEQQVDSYIWTLQYYDILNKQKIFKKGTVTLLK